MHGRASNVNIGGNEREQDREIIIGCENKKAIFLMLATALASEKGINIFSNF